MANLVTQWAHHLFKAVGGGFASITKAGVLTVAGLVNTGTTTLTGKLDASTGGIQVEVSTDDITQPPTDAEMVTAFGAAATVGAGFIGVLDDNGAGTYVALAISDGTNWHYILATDAT